MIKEYIKTVPIKAEKFDGSKEMVEKYHIDQYEISGYGNPDFDYSLETFKGYYSWDKDNSVWIATGVDDEHWIIDDDIFKKTYVEANS